MIYKNARLFVNTFTADHEHYLLNRENLKDGIQMEISKKKKTFSQFFFAFLKSMLNFIHFPKRNDLDSWCISGTINSEKHGYIKV